MIEILEQLFQNYSALLFPTFDVSSPDGLVVRKQPFVVFAEQLCRLHFEAAIFGTICWTLVPKTVHRWPSFLLLYRLYFTHSPERICLHNNNNKDSFFLCLTFTLHHHRVWRMCDLWIFQNAFQSLFFSRRRLIFQNSLRDGAFCTKFIAHSFIVFYNMNYSHDYNDSL